MCIFHSNQLLFEMQYQQPRDRTRGLTTTQEVQVQHVAQTWENKNKNVEINATLVKKKTRQISF